MTHLLHESVLLEENFQYVAKAAIGVSGRVPLVKRIWVHFEVYFSLNLYQLGQSNTSKQTFEIILPIMPLLSSLPDKIWDRIKCGSLMVFIKQLQDRASVIQF